MRSGPPLRASAKQHARFKHRRVVPFWVANRDASDGDALPPCWQLTDLGAGEVALDGWEDGWKEEERGNRGRLIAQDVDAVGVRAHFVHRAADIDDLPGVGGGFLRQQLREVTRCDMGDWRGGLEVSGGYSPLRGVRHQHAVGE